LLEVITRRCERTSLILASNREVDDWGKLLGHTAAVIALPDRHNIWQPWTCLPVHALAQQTIGLPNLVAQEPGCR